MSVMSEVRAETQSPIAGLKAWWKGVKAVQQPETASVDHASFYMLSLYRTNLDVRLRAIDPASFQSESQHEIYSAVTDMLKAPAKVSITARNLEWDEMYKAESLIALLFSGPSLRQEISARLQDLARESPAESENLRREYEGLLKPSAEAANGGADDSMLRALLLRVMEALHWNAKKTYLARPIRIEATNRIVVGMLFSFFLLVFPYIVINIDIARPANNPWWSMFALYTALSAGLLGAFFSRLISIQGQWTNMTLDEVFLHREWPYTILRAGVGVCGALIVYFFLRSGIAEGALFPTFPEIKIELVKIQDDGDAMSMAFVMPSKSLALLTFWCFLAGFSEKFVPNILSSTERQLTEATSPSQAIRK